MTRNQMMLLAFPVLLIFLIAVYEVSDFSVNVYNSTSKFHRSDSWHSVNFTINSLKDEAVGFNSCETGRALTDVPLVVTYQKDSLRDPVKRGCMDHEVSIKEIHHGIMWTPLIKHFDVECKVPVKIERECFRFFGDSTQVVAYRIKGEVKVTGTITIYGMCSVREAGHIMAKGVLENVYASVRQEMDMFK